MNITGVTAIAAVVWTSALANAVPAVEPQVVVCMTHTDDMGLQSQAKSVASAILDSSGVKLQWHDPSQCPGEAIIITLSNNEPASLRPACWRTHCPSRGRTSWCSTIG